MRPVPPRPVTCGPWQPTTPPASPRTSASPTPASPSSRSYGPDDLAGWGSGRAVGRPPARSPTHAWDPPGPEPPAGTCRGGSRPRLGERAGGHPTARPGPHPARSSGPSHLLDGDAGVGDALVRGLAGGVVGPWAAGYRSQGHGGDPTDPRSPAVRDPAEGVLHGRTTTPASRGQPARPGLPGSAGRRPEVTVNMHRSSYSAITSSPASAPHAGHCGSAAHLDAPAEALLEHVEGEAASLERTLADPQEGLRWRSTA